MRAIIACAVALAALLAGCKTASHRPAPDAERALQGEWQLVRYSSFEMFPDTGGGRQHFSQPVDPVLYIFRNGHLTVMEGTNVVTSTPCFVTRYHSRSADSTTLLLHQHPGPDCPSSIDGHDWFTLDGDKLCLGAWDIEYGMGVQNANVYEFRRALMLQSGGTD
mgnify:CR=1 FL=1